MKKRVSLVNYLNSVPLGWGFTQGPFRDDFELILSTPAACADQLRKGEADVGLIPVIEYQLISDLSIIPNIAIGSRKKIKSVLLISKVPIDKITSVSVDSSSRTSSALLKVILSYFYKTQPLVFPHSADLDQMLRSNDAALIIGDAALKISQGNYLIYDLAEQWYTLTTKQFVFAFWAIRSGVQLGKSVDLFHRSKKLGLENIEAIGEKYAPILGLSRAEITSYLTDCVSYDLNSEAIEGLNLFFNLALNTGLINRVKPLNFHGTAMIEHFIS